MDSKKNLRSVRSGKAVTSDLHMAVSMPMKRLCLAMFIAFAGIGAPISYANDVLPTVPEVVSGGVDISTTGPSMRIDTHTPTTVINWKDFSIGPDNKVHFQQPDGSSITFNRVMGSSPSAIYGVLTSNGQLVLLNPNGIWFGPNSHIAASALVAGAGMVTNEQIEQLSKTGKLDINLSGLVRNEGHISIADHGAVALLGAQVENSGIAQAREGQMTLATGPLATLDFNGDGLISLAVVGDTAERSDINSGLKGGVYNEGHIDVGGGVVVMSAQRAAKHLESVISVGGSVIANSVSQQGGSILLGNSARTEVNGKLSAQGRDGGSIKVLGDDVKIGTHAVVDASGTEGNGGTVLIGGSYQGKGGEAAAKSTVVDQDAQLRADGKNNGGTIVAWSNGKTHFAGSASAKGGNLGGVVETSGRELSVADSAQVNVSGGKQAGTWLLDPHTVNIVEQASGEDVSASVISSAMAHGNVRVEATDRINVNAPIIVSQAVDAHGNPHTLVLIAKGSVGSVTTYDGTDKSNSSGSVQINAPILLKDGNLFIDATGDVSLNNTAPGATGDLAMMGRAIIDVGKGTIWIDTSNTASVKQADGTALIGKNVAVRGASVVLNSTLNFAGTLAGAATNGRFVFHQSNATGTTQVGSVASPFGSVGQSMSGVTVHQVEYLGSQTIQAGAGDNYDKAVTLSIGGQSFDYLVFEATGYVDKNGKSLTTYTDSKGAVHPIADYGDSSDYLVNGVQFTDSLNVQWKVVPDASNTETLARFYKWDGGKYVATSEKPANFSFDAHQGIAAVAVVDGTTYGWGVTGYEIPGAKLREEIQYDADTGSSEQLVMALGSSTKEVKATLSWLIDDKIWDNNVKTPLLEKAQIHFLANKDQGNTAELTAHKAELGSQIADQTRQYGDANSAFSHSELAAKANSQAVHDLDRFVDRQLQQDRFAHQVDYSTQAADRSNVGQYGINGQLSTGSFVSRRYEVNLGSAKLVITPAPLVVRIDDKAKQVGETDPALTYKAEGWKFAEDERDFALNRGPGEVPGNYLISEKDGTRLVSANYAVTVVNGNLQIEGPVAPIAPKGQSAVQGSSPSQGATSERCTPTESPSAVVASHSASPAVVRTYTVQLVCKPRAYGSPEEQLPDKVDLLNYANGLLKDGQFQLPDWNRSVMPHALPQDQE